MLLLLWKEVVWSERLLTARFAQYLPGSAFLVSSDNVRRWRTTPAPAAMDDDVNALSLIDDIDELLEVRVRAVN